MVECDICHRRFTEKSIKYLFRKRIRRFVEVCPGCYSKELKKTRKPKIR
jgi:hypothetical protein